MIDGRGIVPKLRQSPFRKNFRQAGEIASINDDWSGAAEQYRAHLDLYPDDIEIWTRLAQVSIKANNLDEALEACQRALSLSPKNAELMLTVGHVYKMLGNVAAALDAYIASTHLKPALSGGAALVQIELLTARLQWRSDDPRSDKVVVTDLPTLLMLAKKDEAAGRGVFTRYFSSFDAR